jgi:hypothetical protein
MGKISLSQGIDLREEYVDLIYELANEEGWYDYQFSNLTNYILKNVNLYNRLPDFFTLNDNFKKNAGTLTCFEDYKKHKLDSRREEILKGDPKLITCEAWMEYQLNKVEKELNANVKEFYENCNNAFLNGKKLIN